MSLRVHGVAACDSCRKARRWLSERGIDFDWVDLRADGIDATRVQDWLQRVEPARLLNRRSTTWRQLPKERRPAPDDPELAAFLALHPTLIKRPVFERDDGVAVGFDDDARAWLATS